MVGTNPAGIGANSAEVDAKALKGLVRKWMAPILLGFLPHHLGVVPGLQKTPVPDR